MCEAVMDFTARNNASNVDASHAALIDFQKSAVAIAMFQLFIGMDKTRPNFARSSKSVLTRKLRDILVSSINP